MYFGVNVSDDTPNGEEHDVQSNMFRLNITDMQDKYCDSCYDIHLFKVNTKETAKEVAAEGRATFCVVEAEGRHLAVTTLLALHVGNSRSEHV